MIPSGSCRFSSRPYPHGGVLKNGTEETPLPRPAEDTESCSSSGGGGSSSHDDNGESGRSTKFGPMLAWQSLSNRWKSLSKRHKEELDCWICLCPVERCNEEGQPNGCHTHPAHIECLQHRILAGRKDPMISFGYLDCGVCRTRLDFSSFEDFVRPVLDFERKVCALDRQWAAVQKNDAHQFVFYSCFKCAEPFFGGLKRCQASDAPEPEPETLVCPPCSGAGLTHCEVHGSEFINYKCKHCCRLPATFTCGSVHWCEVCHTPPYTPSKERTTCPGNADCIFKCQMLWCLWRRSCPRISNTCTSTSRGCKN